MDSDLYEEFQRKENDANSRYIFPLKAKRPIRHRYAVFDCETRTLKRNEFPEAKYPAQKIELRYVYAELHDARKPTTEKFDSGLDTPDMTQKLAFTKKLIAWARDGNYLTAWAHNAMFDTCAAIDFEYLANGAHGYKFIYTFVSTHPFIFKLKGFPRKGKPLLIKILDTYSFYKYPLAKLAPYFGMEKVRIDDWEGVDNETLLKRCHTDVEITAKIVEDLYTRMRGHTAVSAPQLAYMTFRTMMYRKIEKLGGLSIESYHGGRTEIFKRLSQPHSVRFDVNSMYPWAMQQSLPISHGMKSTNPKLDFIIDNCSPQKGSNFPKYLATIRAIVNVPQKYIAPFPYWDGERLMFPTGRFETVINSPEFMVMDNWKYIEKVKEVEFFRGEPFLSQYADKFYHEKLLASKKKDAIGREYNKLLLNSLFGKFGQKKKETLQLPKELEPLTEGHVWTGVEDIEVDRNYLKLGLSEGDVLHVVYIAGQPVYSVELDYNISPAVASFITSWARSRLYQMGETHANKELIYVDTDCLVVPERVMNNFKPLIGDAMGLLKEEFRGTFVGFAPKVYIFDGITADGEKKLEVKSKGVPRDLFLEAVKNGEKKVTFEHILGFKERLRRYHTVGLLQSTITRSLSLKDSKRQWDGNDSMPLQLNQN